MSDECFTKKIYSVIFLWEESLMLNGVNANLTWSIGLRSTLKLQTLHDKLGDITACV